MTEQVTKGEWEALSAYLDGQLARRKRDRLEKMLQMRPELRLALAELKRTRIILRSQPRIRAPRHFTLTPEMVGARKAMRPQSWFFESMRLASVLASLIFVLAVFGEVFFSSRLSTAVPMGVETQAIAELAAPVEEAAVEAGPTMEAAIQDTNLTLEVEKAAEPAFAMTHTPTPAAAEPAATEAGMGLEMPPSFASGERSTYPAPGAPPVEMLQQGTALEPTATAVGEALPSAGLPAAAQPENAQVRQRGVAQPGFWTTWRIVELGLVIVGLSTGLVALYLRRTGRV